MSDITTAYLAPLLLGIWTIVGLLLLILLVRALLNDWPRWPKVIHTETDVTSIGLDEVMPKSSKAKIKPASVKLPSKLSFTCTNQTCGKVHEIDASTTTLKCDCGAEYEFTR